VEKGNHGAFMAAKRRTKAHIPKQILNAIKRVWPDSIVQIDYDLVEESYFHELYPKLHRSLSSIEGASLRYERQANEQRHGDDDWDLGDSNWSDSLPIEDRTYSYHLFFICSDHQLFRYETETEEPDEEDPDVEQAVAGEGFIGCVVGVSLLARFAVVGLNSFHEYESGSHTCPELEVCAFDENGERVTAEEYFCGQVGAEGMHLLYDLRDQIAKVLQSHRITVLSEQDQQKAVPWLRAGEEVLKGEGQVTVKGALFFEAL
jgi:hypothetical protein